MSAPSSRLPCAVLGATGLVGQVFVSRLARHPWFEPTVLVASGARAGRPYGEVVDWRLPEPLPVEVAKIPLSTLGAPNAAGARNTTRVRDAAGTRDALGDVRLAFSSLPRGLAAEIERPLVERGIAVFSNAGAHRMDDDVPILVPEVNAERVDDLAPRAGGGFLVTNSNCTTAGLVLALGPLRTFGLERVTVATYQSLSGAGLAGLARLDPPEPEASASPWIPNEEEKVVAESRKVLGVDVPVASTCVRVPVAFGHVEAVWVELAVDPGEEGIRSAWAAARVPGPPGEALPSSPARPIREVDHPDELRHDRAFEGDPPGMELRCGRLAADPARPASYRFVLLVNNIVRGAAGGSIHNAELCVARGLLA